MTRPRLGTLLLVPLLGAVTLGGAALGLFVHRSVERDLFATIDDELTRVIVLGLDGPGGINPDPGNPRPDPTTGEPPGPDPGNDAGPNQVAPQEVKIGSRGEVIDFAPDSTDLADRNLTLFAGEKRTATVAGEPRIRAMSRPTNAGTTLVVGISLAQVDQSLAALRRNLILGIAVLVALQAAIVALVVRMANKPIRQLVAVAHRIADGELDAAIGPPSGPRETANLTDDLTVMVDRLRSTINERERAATAAERARADMQRFMAHTSHELRTPLTALQGYSDLHRAGMLDDEGVDRAMHRIGAESERLSNLVDELLVMLRPIDQQKFEPVDLAAIASAVVEDLRAGYSTHPLRLDLVDADGCVVLGDASRLHQAVLNLGANAVQHTAQETAVEVVVRRIDKAETDGAEPTLAEIRVVDHGAGISIDGPIEVDLFQPFVRLDSSRSRQDHDGAGLGLTITQTILQQHNGTVELTSTPGGGLTAIIRIPLTTADNRR